MRSIENSDKIRQASAGTMAICVRVYGSCPRRPFGALRAIVASINLHAPPTRLLAVRPHPSAIPGFRPLIPAQIDPSSSPIPTLAARSHIILK